MNPIRLIGGWSVAETGLKVEWFYGDSNPAEEGLELRDDYWDLCRDCRVDSI